MATEQDFQNLKQQAFVGGVQTKAGDSVSERQATNINACINANTKNFLASNRTCKSWESCYYCPRENFKAVSEFVK